jgi:hypothetical protein
MNVALDDADRAVAEDFRERREVDPLFGHACSEGVAEVVENQIQLDAGRLCLLAETIMRVVYPGDVPARIPPRGKDPGRGRRRSLCRSVSARSRLGGSSDA